jgi:transposase InsO family protein
MIAAQFLRNLIAAEPDKIPMVRTDNGLQFTHRQRDQSACRHLFDHVRPEQGLEPRLPQVKHLCTNGQVERINRTVQEVTVQTYYDQTHQHLKNHLQAFLMP